MPGVDDFAGAAFVVRSKLGWLEALMRETM